MTEPTKDILFLTFPGTSQNSELFQQAKEWIPKIYDLDTYKYDMPKQIYFKFGNLYIMFIYMLSGIDISDISTMLQIRNKPCKWIIGGNCYFGNISSVTRTIQASDTAVYFRPNVTKQNATTTGVFSALLFGLDKIGV